MFKSRMGKKGLFLMVAIVLVLLSVALAGCGGQGANAPSGGADKAPAQGASAQNFFADKTVTFIVPFGPGGGYDTYSRMIQPFLQKKLGAQAVIVKNVPGGGSLSGTNQLYHAKADGLTIGVLNVVGLVANQIAGAQGVEYDLNKFSWIGRVVAEPQAIVTGNNSPIKSIQELIGSQKELKWGSTGYGTEEYVTAMVLKNSFKIPIRVVTGYDSSSEADLALIKGEIDIYSGSWSSKLKALKNKDTRVLVVAGEQRVPEYPDVPTLGELTPQTPEGSILVKSFGQMMVLGRSIAGPPGIPADRLKQLREAWDGALKDPELLQMSQQSDRPLNNLDGDKMTSTVADLMAKPAPEFVDLVKASFPK